jgi:hypothetical protein
MDAMTRSLLVEVARTVLKVLDPLYKPEEAQAPVAHPTPWATAINPLADRGNPPSLNSQAAVLAMLAKKEGAPKAATEPSKASPHIHTRGMAVRCWDGSKYVHGTVTALSRSKPGRPLTVDVVIDRGPDRRPKTLKVEAAKAEILKGAA